MQERVYKVKLSISNLTWVRLILNPWILKKTMQERMCKDKLNISGLTCYKLKSNTQLKNNAGARVHSQTQYFLMWLEFD